METVQHGGRPGKPKSKVGMHREDIKAGLRKRGLSVAIIARRLGVDRSTVANVLAGRRSRRIEGAIARALKIRREVLWPERYPAEAICATCTADAIPQGCPGICRRAGLLKERCA